jgi:hypothetical protein
VSDYGKTLVWIGVKGVLLDPESFTREVGIDPDGSWTRGDIRKTGLTTHSNGAWLIETPMTECAKVEPLVAGLLDRLHGIEDRFDETVRAHEAEACLTIVIYAGVGFPACTFSAAILGRIARLGLSLDFDLYTCELDGE